MVFGECPHCNEPFTASSPERTPQMGKITCEECGKWFWEYFSRINPQAFMPDEVIVDEENKTVKFAEGVGLK